MRRGRRTNADIARRDLVPAQWAQCAEVRASLPHALRGAFVAELGAHTGLSKATVLRRLQGRRVPWAQPLNGRFTSLRPEQEALLAQALADSRGQATVEHLWATVLGAPDRPSRATVARWAREWRRRDIRRLQLELPLGLGHGNKERLQQQAMQILAKVVGQ